MAVTHPSLDRLDRVRFAEALAQQIWNMQAPKEGYVFGLEGEWGAGKSSVMNLILHRLLHLELEERSSQAAFHGDRDGPFSQALLDKLAEHFESIVELGSLPKYLNYVHPDHYHRQIAAAASGDPDLERQIYRYFRLRLRAVEEPKCLVVHFRPWLIPDTAALSTVFIGELVTAIGSKFGSEVEEAFGHYSDLVERLAPIAGAAAQAVLPGADGIVKGFISIFGTQKPKTLDEVKNSLEAALRRLRGQKLVVVIDDLDRLSPNEATEMVGLVKSLGNLPNVIYLISYEPHVLAKHIQRTLRVDGDAYLEKIIQYRRRLPLLREQALSSLMEGYLAPLFSDVSGDVVRRIEEALSQIGRLYIRTPRDANRCGQWIEQSVRALQSQTDIADLIILEMIQAKDVSLYSWIRGNLDDLCSSESRVAEKFIATFGKKNLPVNEARVLALSTLFPAAAKAFNRIEPTSTNARLERRIQIRDFADAYFDISASGLFWSKDRVQDLLNSSDPATSLRSYLDETWGDNHGGIIRADLLDLLSIHFSKNNLTEDWIHAINFVSPALLRAEDAISGSAFAADNLVRLERIFVNALSFMPKEMRFPCLFSLFQQDADLSLAASVFRRVKKSLDDSSSDKKIIEMRAAELIADLAHRNQIFSSADPAEILFLWHQIGFAEEVKVHICEQIDQKRNLVPIVRMLLNTVVSSNEGTYYRISEWGREWLPYSNLQAWAMEKLDSEDHATNLWAKRFLDALERKRRKDA